jgi:hypothetical protein
MTQLNTEAKRRRVCEIIAKAPDEIICILKDSTRTLEQNAMFHALCREASLTHKFMGRKLSTAQWKVLFVSGHAIATGKGADMVPGLEGEFVNLRESTAQMGIKRMISLIEYSQAYLDANEE